MNVRSLSSKCAPYVPLAQRSDPRIPKLHPSRHGRNSVVAPTGAHKAIAIPRKATRANLTAKQLGIIPIVGLILQMSGITVKTGIATIFMAIISNTFLLSL
eukprot:3041913-Amphidinium_carterae.1